jgi:hypothetical protein
MLYRAWRWGDVTVFPREVPIDGSFQSLVAVRELDDTGTRALYGCGPAGLTRMTTDGSDSGIVFNSLGSSGADGTYGLPSRCGALVSLGDTAVGLLGDDRRSANSAVFIIDANTPTRWWAGHRRP